MYTRHRILHADYVGNRIFHRSLSCRLVLTAAARRIEMQSTFISVYVDWSARSVAARVGKMNFAPLLNKKAKTSALTLHVLFILMANPQPRHALSFSLPRSCLTLSPSLLVNNFFITTYERTKIFLWTVVFNPFL